MDVSPIQLVSPAAALIPFLEHDDANRALMGSNMQRQAVPLLATEAPLVGTGLEDKVAQDSGALVLARRSGVVEFVSGEMIAVRYERDATRRRVDYSDQPNLDIYRLIKFRRSNQDTCLNQRPVVTRGPAGQEGRGASPTARPRANGELALGAQRARRVHAVGRLQLRGRHPGERDGSSRTTSSPRSTSRSSSSRCATPSAASRRSRARSRTSSEDAVKNLDEDGVIRIGARVAPGDILVGKVTPKGEQELSPEERLLKAIFGDKAGDVRDASLKAPPGHGRHRHRHQGVLAPREGRRPRKQQEKKKIEKLRRETQEGARAHRRRARSRRVRELLDEQTRERAAQRLDRRARWRARAASSPRSSSTEIDLDDLAVGHAGRPRTTRSTSGSGGDGRRAGGARRACDKELEKEIEKVTRGDELPPGVVKLVKVYIAKKRKLSVGDKMAGRHGNKGVVAKILPEEDMPYLPDGTPVEIVLNPLGVPSRMNIGQVLETHLGWAAHALGLHVRDAGVRRRDGRRDQGASCAQAGLPEDGKTELRRRPHGRAVRPARHGRLHLHAEAHRTSSTTRSTPARPVRTRSSRSSRWAARRSSAASASAKWKCGRSRPTARPTRCRSCSPSRATTSRAARGSTRRSSRARTRRSPACPSRSTCW